MTALEPQQLVDPFFGFFCYYPWATPLDHLANLSTSPTEQVRVAFGRWVQQRTGTSVEDIQETMLIRQGCYCGKRLCCQGFSAIWFVEESQIKLFGAEGQSFGTQPVAAFLQFASDSPNQKAA